MRKLLIDDFNNQKKNIIGILLVTILGAIVGFAFQSVYYCTGILITSGICIIFFSCFSDYQIAEAALKRAAEAGSEDRITRISRKKLQVRTKYVEILFISVILYIILTAAFIVDAIDSNLFIDPDYDVADSLEKISLFPLSFIFLTSITIPLLLKKNINKAGFITLAFISILVPYGIFLLDFLTDFTENKTIMVILPFPVIAVSLISYFIAMTIVIRER